MKTTIVLVIDHKKPIPDLTDIAAGRIYTLDGVEDVTAELRPEPAVAEQARDAEKVASIKAAVSDYAKHLQAVDYWSGKVKASAILTPAYASRSRLLDAINAALAPQSTPEAA